MDRRVTKGASAGSARIEQFLMPVAGKIIENTLELTASVIDGGVVDQRGSISKARSYHHKNGWI